MKMKVAWMLVSCAACIFYSCKNNDDHTEHHGPWADIWSVSPISRDSMQQAAICNDIQIQIDSCPYTAYNEYLGADDAVADSMERQYPALEIYDMAFERVLDGLKDVAPYKNDVYIWYVYNMGYVVRTHNGAFAMDVAHRRSAELAPYIDFAVMTHRHGDHKSLSLAYAMRDLGKPVVANFAIDGLDYTYITLDTLNYSLGDIKVHSFVTNHNHTPIEELPVTVFRLEYATAQDTLVLVHSGDSDFRAEQFRSLQDDDVDIYILRYALKGMTENSVIGNVFSPKYALLSHVAEMSHPDIEHDRIPWSYGLKRTAQLNCSNVYLPVWGDKMVWRNGKLR